MIVNASIGHIIHSLHHGQTAQDAGGYDALHLLDDGAQPQGKGHHHPVLLPPPGFRQGGQLRLADGDRLFQKERQAAGQNYLSHGGMQGAPGTDEYAVGTALLQHLYRVPIIGGGGKEGISLRTGACRLRIGLADCGGLHAGLQLPESGQHSLRAQAVADKCDSIAHRTLLFCLFKIISLIPKVVTNKI